MKGTSAGSGISLAEAAAAIAAEKGDNPRKTVSWKKDFNSRKCLKRNCHNDAHRRCSRCNEAYYCGSVCQKADWKAVHKHKCVKKAKVKSRMLRCQCPYGGHDYCRLPANVNDGPLDIYTLVCDLCMPCGCIASSHCTQACPCTKATASLYSTS